MNEVRYSLEHGLS